MMFRQLQDIQGMQVVALAEGRIMGTVQKIYLNSAQKRVSGMSVRESGFGGQESWVEVRDIEKVGENVIFVTRAGSCKAKSPVGRSLKDMMGLQVATKSGKILGLLVDIEIDESWHVVEINLSEKRVVNIEPRQAVFGQDAILLRADAESKVRAASRNKTGFLARVFGKETVQETAGAITRAEKAAVPAGRSTARVSAPKKKKKGSRKR
jgi:sporulation protein YlmC with PRC-barrel domain